MTSIGGIGWSPRLGSEKSHDVHGWIVVYQKPDVLGWRIHTGCPRLEALTGRGMCVCVWVCVWGVCVCCLDTFLLKNVTFLFWKSNFKMALIWKKGLFFDLLLTFFSHQGKDTNIPSAHTSLTYIHEFCSPYWLFCLTNFAKNCEFIMYGLFWCDSWCWFLWSNQWIRWAKFKLERRLLPILPKFMGSNNVYTIIVDNLACFVCLFVCLSEV